MVNLSDHKNIHCIGIGGIGLSAIAEILLSKGFKVSGSDMKESIVTDRLASLGVRICIGHSAENLKDADLVVYSAAIASDNPELIFAQDKGIRLASRAELLGTLMQQYENGIAISGTHGKTTTTSMVALILNRAKMDPTILVGGELAEIGGNVQVGHGDYFVTEACEYRDSFLQLCPDTEIILNIDSDHLDYFKDIDHIVKSFAAFAEKTPEDGRIIAYDANPFVREVIKDKDNAITFGYNSESTYSASEVRFNDGMPVFNVNCRGKRIGEVELQIPGEHNIMNALAATACCHEIGVDFQVIRETLSSYTGIQRRFDIKGLYGKGIKLVDDYAHHPTEIRATLSAAEKLPHKKIFCVFQPHTYTRTLALFNDFAEAFEETDVLIVTDIYAAREHDIYNISSEKLVTSIREAHPEKEVFYISDFYEIVDFIDKNTEKGDLVITMGAGDVYKIGDMIMNQ